MFKVNGTTIMMSIGDTGSVTITATGHTFTDEDRAIFTVKNASGVVVKEGYFEMEDGSFTVDFANADTDGLKAGTYSWDVRYVINPYYDDDDRIIDGDEVITPNQPMALQLVNVVGEV